MIETSLFYRRWKRSEYSTKGRLWSWPYSDAWTFSQLLGFKTNLWRRQQSLRPLPLIGFPQRSVVFLTSVMVPMALLFSISRGHQPVPRRYPRRIFLPRSHCGGPKPASAWCQAYRWGVSQVFQTPWTHASLGCRCCHRRFKNSYCYSFKIIIA